MGTVIDTYLTQAKLNASNYIKNAKAVVQWSKAINQSQRAALQPRGAGGQFQGRSDPRKWFIKQGFTKQGLSDAIGVGSMPTAIDLVSTFAKSIGALSLATVGAAVGAAKQAAEFDSLRMSLAAVDGGSKKAEDSLRRLKGLARAPGLGFKEAVEAYVGLRGADVSQGFSERLIKGFANANARRGGGKDNFANIMRAVMQISVKPFLQGDELLQLNEAGLPAQKWVKDAFGTADTEQLKARGIDSAHVLEALVKELEKMPVAAGGAQNTWDNLMDSVSFGVVQVGDAVNAAFGQMGDDLSKTIDSGTRGGMFTGIGESISNAIMDVLGAQNTDELLIDVVAGVRTMIDVLRNVWLNLKDIANFFMHPFGLGSIKGSGQSYLEDTYKNYQNEARMSLDLGRKLEKKDAAKEPAEEAARMAAAVKDHPDSLDTTMRKVERNTRDIADIARQAWDPSERILGGTGMGGGPSRMELSKIRAGGGKSNRAHTLLGMALDELAGQIALQIAQANGFEGGYGF